MSCDRNKQYLFQFQALEARTLCSFDQWGATAQLIHQPQAIDAFPSLDGSGQVIALIDSGIDYNTPALGGGFGSGFKVIDGYDFVDNDADPMDTIGHGTEVAGMIGASRFVADGSYYQGIAPAAKLVALRVDDGQSSVPDSRIELALQWCITHQASLGLSVVNISYGNGQFAIHTTNQVYSDEIKTLTDMGVMVVASSGNGGILTQQGVDMPAADNNVISVGAVDSQDIIQSYTERGAILDMLAPGTDVYTTLLGNVIGQVEGTSFASPIIAGTIALMRQIDPSLKPNDIRSILQSSGVANKDGDNEAGTVTNLTFSRVDILGALQLTTSRMPTLEASDPTFARSGNNNSIAVDQYGITHLVYFDSTAATMKYTTRSASGFWSTAQIIDNSIPNQGIYVSMAVDGLGKPSIAYCDGNNSDLKFASFNGITWTLTTIDSKNSTGLYPSMLFDQNGNPAISYYRKTTGDLRLARRSSLGIWSIEAISTENDVGRSCSLAMDKRGRLGIAYEDSSAGDLRIALQSLIDGSWSSVMIDRREGCSYISMKFDNSNRPSICYYDGAPANLRYLTYVNRKWKYTNIATRGATGLFSNLMFNNNNQAIILYWDKRNNNAVIARGTDDVWTTEILATGAGKFIASSLDTYNSRIIFSYFLPATTQLRIASILQDATNSGSGIQIG